MGVDHFGVLENGDLSPCRSTNYGGVLWRGFVSSGQFQSGFLVQGSYSTSCVANTAVNLIGDLPGFG